MNLPEPCTTTVRISASGRRTFIPRDSRGVELKVGQHVAFNWSGNVATGRIGFIGAAVQIKRDPEFRSSYSASDVSRVRNKSSILVLEDV